MSDHSANGHKSDEQQVRVNVDLRSASIHAACCRASTSAHRLSRVLCTALPYSGGLEQLFGRLKRHELLLSPAADGDDGRLTLRSIIRYMKDRKLKDRPELFTQDGTVSAQRSTAAADRAMQLELLLTVLHFSLVSLAASSCSRPGILVLVNDCDWELVDSLNCIVRDGDCVTFISTLHGG